MRGALEALEKTHGKAIDLHINDNSSLIESGYV